MRRERATIALRVLIALHEGATAHRPAPSLFHKEGPTSMTFPLARDPPADSASRSEMSRASRLTLALHFPGRDLAQYVCAGLRNSRDFWARDVSLLRLHPGEMSTVRNRFSGLKDTP